MQTGQEEIGMPGAGADASKSASKGGAGGYSSAPPAEKTAIRRRSLALRTMAGVVSLVALSLVLLAAFTLTVAGRVVESQLEQNVTEAWRRTSGFVAEPDLSEEGPGSSLRPPSLTDTPPAAQDTPTGAEETPENLTETDVGTEQKNPINTPGLPVGTVVLMETADGAIVYANEIDSSGQRLTLAAADTERLRQAVDSAGRSADEKTLTGVELSSGDYLVQSGQLPNGETFTLGISTAEGDHTKSQLLVIQLVGCALALLLVGLGVWWWIRRSLRPLRQVSRAAARVSEVPMSSGNVALDQYRVDDELSQPRDEVGDVGYALNQLIDSVDSALADRAASEDRLRAFVADASHELRTPLASVRGYAEMLQLTEPLQENGQKLLQRVLEQSERMSALVENLLLLARLDAAQQEVTQEANGAKASGDPEAGKLSGVGPAEPDASEDTVSSQGDHGRAGKGREREATDTSPAHVHAHVFDLGELVIDAVMDANAAGRDHLWNADIPDEPVLIAGDATQISQLLANLLSNARKHTPGGTEVNIRLRATDHEAIFTVADNGPGIPPELLGKVFDRFVRGDAVRTGTEGSTGLGLSIVRSVAQAHGGEVSVASAGGGTEFRVALPLAGPNAGRSD
ncbi:HAMP domain-containing sensor histidine kinase [Actinomycetaceae bacterium L2_0104]